MKKILKGSAFVLATLLVLVQFVRPEKNTSSAPSPYDIAAQYDLPSDIHAMLRTSCYDCHSNSTRYPWYADIQPIGWWLNQHITEAKRELNFSEFGRRNPRWQLRKLDEIAEQLEKNEMPLPSYLLAHPEARLSAQQKEQLIAWTKAMKQRVTGATHDIERQRRE